MPDTTPGSRRKWLFQWNPDLWPPEGDGEYDDLESGKESILNFAANWSCPQHEEEVAEGDIAMLWRAKGASVRADPDRWGIVAMGYVVGEPYEGVDWYDPDLQGIYVDLDMRIDLYDAPIHRETLKSDPRFAGAKIIKTPHFGTVFPVSGQEWEAIKDCAAKQVRRQIEALENGTLPGPTETA